MSSLQAFYSGAFETSTSTLNDVLIAGNTTSQNIVSTGSISCSFLTAAGAVSGASVTASGAVSGATVAASGAVSGATVAASGAVSGASASISGDVASATVTASGAISGASVTASGAVSGATVTSSGAISGVNITSTGVMTIQNPLFPSYSALSYPVTAGAVGTVVPITESVSTVPLNTGGEWSPFYTSTTVLPLGIYMLSTVVLFNNVEAVGLAAMGVVNDSTSTAPLAGTYAASRNTGSISPSLNFTTFFVSETGFQSPKFLTQCDTNNTNVTQLEWCAVKIG